MKSIVLPLSLIVLASLVVIPGLHVPSAAGSTPQPWSFRDDFNYTSISQLQAAGWTTESIAPASYYSIGNSILTLLNDGHVGAGAGYSNIPANFSDWSVSTRVEWIGSSGNVSGYVGSLQVAVQTAKHSYDWMADGYYGHFDIGMDGRNVVTISTFTKQLNVWHILRLDMIQGTLYGYFDGQLVASYAEPDTTPGNTNLTAIEALASWETNNNFDWMQANNSPTPPVLPPSFSLKANSPSISLLAGQAGNSIVTVGSQNGFSGTVSLSSVESPTGPSIQLTPSSVAVAKGGNANSTLTVGTQSSTPSNTYTITVTASSGNLTSSVTLTVVVNSGSADFTITESPTSHIIPLGSEQQTVLELDSVNGFSGNVNLVAAPSSSAIACWFTYTLTSTATLYVPPNGYAYQYPTCGAYGAAGSYTVTFSATAGSLSHSVVLSVTLVDFSIAASSSPASPTGNATVTLTSLSGLSGPISLAVSAPSTITVSCPPSVNLSPRGTIAVSCPYSGAVGTYDVTFTGTFVCNGCYYDGRDSHSVAATLNVLKPAPPDFAILANPNGLALAPGSSANSTVTLTSLAGFSGTVNLSTSISPTGPTVSLNPASVTVSSGGTGTSILRISTTATTPTGNYTITVNAVSGSLSHSITLSLSITVASFTITETPTSQAIPILSERQTVIQVDSVNGFSGDVNLVATPSSTSVACWFTYTLTNKATVTVPAGGDAYQYPTCGAYGPAGSFTVTITGTSGSITYSVVLQVTVLDFSLSASSVSFTQGSSGASTVTLTSLSGLSGPVSLTLSTPTGLTASCPSSTTLSSNGISTASCTFSSAVAGNYTATITGKFVCADCYYDGTDSHSTTATITVTSTDPPVSSTFNFQGITITTSGSLSVISGTVSGTVSVTATNSSSGTVLFSKTYTITNVRIGMMSQGRFILNIGVNPYRLSADVTVSQTSGVWSASVMVTRQLDIAGRGSVDIVDFSIAAMAFNTHTGSSLYNPAADLIGTGTVNITDIAMLLSFYGAPDYS